MSEAVLNLSRWFFRFSGRSGVQAQVAVQRLPLVDWVKAIAAQMIVLHHLSLYGPLSRVAAERYPKLVFVFYEYGLMAVQAFLVVGGFLAVRGLAPEGKFLVSSPLGLIWKRYQRLVPPFAIAMILAIVGSWLASYWMQDGSLTTITSIKDLATRFAAHLVLLHNILDVEALSAGVWYIAIDFQLFAILLGILWLANRLGTWQQKIGIQREIPWTETLVFLATIAALFILNRNAKLDIWGIYFVGSYGLGALAYWISKRPANSLLMGLVVVSALLALYIDFRLRIAVALAVAMLLMWVSQQENVLQKLRSRWVAALSRTSYGLFLVHFPVCLLVNAVFDRFVHPGPALALFGIVVAWMLSMLAGSAFERWVEKPLQAQRG